MQSSIIQVFSLQTASVERDHQVYLFIVDPHEESMHRANKC